MSDKFYPSIATLIRTEDLPQSLGFLQGIADNILGDLFYKELQIATSMSGDRGIYQFKLLCFNKIKLDIPGTGLTLILNPSDIPDEGSEFLLRFSYYIGILKYIPFFNLNDFDWSYRAFFDLVIKITEENTQTILKGTINTFIIGTDTIQKIEIFIDNYNTNYPDKQITVTESTDEDIYIQNILDGFEQIDVNAYDVVYNDYVYDVNVTVLFSKIDNLSVQFVGFISIESLKQLLIPRFSASISDLSLALAFPRSILKPIDPSTGEPYLEEDDEKNEVKSMLRFNVGALSFLTESGFKFEGENTFIFDRSEIGNTGIQLELDGIKLDFSTDSNILEADADDRDNNFIGVYAESAAIILPSKWFNNVDNTTLQVVGRKLLLGTGGISGTIALETVSGQPNNGIAYMSTHLGSWEVGFNYFDITFHQNVITGSNIQGKLKIPKLKDANNKDAEIIVKGHLGTSGDFSLTASEPDGIPLTLFNFVTFNFLTLEVGREDDKFYLGTNCEVSFPETSFLHQYIGDQKIVLSNLRIYSDGSMELARGTNSLPANVSLHLGPVDMSVTSIYFGSYQQKYGDNTRKYNYFGFDGAINVDPLGVDARGKGLKYCYTVDNLNIAA